jgi:hypothetical protein
MPPTCLERLAESLVLHLARVRSNGVGSRAKLLVAIFDSRASSWCSELTANHPRLARFCELIPIEEEVTAEDGWR